MSYYEILLFLHIGVVAIWIGSAFLFFALFQRAKRSGDPLLAERLGALSAYRSDESGSIAPTEAA